LQKLKTIIFLLVVFGISNFIYFKEQPLSERAEKFEISKTKIVDANSFVLNSPIKITSDNNLTDLFPGSGTITDPIRISGLSIINMDTPLISITGTTLYLRIENNFLDGLGGVQDGILLQNVENAIIVNNTIQDNSRGISIDSSVNVTIEGNKVDNSNYVNYEDRSGGITVIGSRNTLISNNQVSNSKDLGIVLNNSVDSIIETNTVTFSEQVGIAVLNSENSRIRSNTVTNSSNSGIWMDFSIGTTVSDNWIWNSSAAGIANNDSGNTTINDNIIRDTALSGIYNIHATYADIFNNLILREGLGIAMIQSSKSNVTNNIVKESLNQGIGISQSQKILVIKNIVENNYKTGIHLEITEDTIITNNTVTNNTQYGLALGKESKNNQVRYNKFIGNNLPGHQSVDNGSNNLVEFNYWNEWTSPDMNSNGIVDKPYNIDGSALNRDLYPLNSLTLYFNSTIEETTSNQNPFAGLIENIITIMIASIGGGGIGITLAVVLKRLK
jgi:parallel beta-helix repeat protein